jgi:hypothetical protein
MEAYKSGCHSCRRKLTHQNRISGLICPLLPPREFVKSRPIRKMVGRGGGDRNDRQTNNACALYALQPPPLANWNKRNKRQAEPSQVCRAADTESQQQLRVWLGPERSTTRRLNRLAGVARFRSSGLLLRNSGQPVVLPEFATGRGDHSPQADFTD